MQKRLAVGRRVKILDQKDPRGGGVQLFLSICYLHNVTLTSELLQNN